MKEGNNKDQSRKQVNGKQTYNEQKLTGWKCILWNNIKMLIKTDKEKLIKHKSLTLGLKRGTLL